MAMVAFSQGADFPGSDFSIFHILVYVQLQGWGIMISCLSIDFRAGLKISCMWPVRFDSHGGLLPGWRFPYLRMTG